MTNMIHHLLHCVVKYTIKTTTTNSRYSLSARACRFGPTSNSCSCCQVTIVGQSIRLSPPLSSLSRQALLSNVTTSTIVRTLVATTSVDEISIGGLSVDEIDDRIIRLKEEQNLDDMNTVINELNVLIASIRDLTNRDSRDHFGILNGLLGLAEGYAADIQKVNEKMGERKMHRVAPINTGLDETLKHSIDFEQFLARVNQLFEWYGQYETYTAPYFPMIQSSGMGKTRLLMELKTYCNNESNECDFDCFVILCSDYDNNDEESESFDAVLHTKSLLGGDDAASQSSHYNDMFDQLNKLITSPQVLESNKKKIVLLFDEAHHLTQDDRNGLSFICLQWWLRVRRSISVVAVLTSTTLKLTDCYRDCTAITDSRCGNYTIYNNDHSATLLYEPFFRIATIGCYSVDKPQGTNDCSFTTAVYFGRPLFAHLYKSNQLLNDELIMSTGPDTVRVVNRTLYNITKQMVLGADHKSWQQDDCALYSILATRVQMGITTSIELSSNLVAKGYANLVHFQQRDVNIGKNAIALIAFMPDPVCAALAMGLMDKTWSLTKTNTFDCAVMQGMDPSVWSKTAMEMFGSGLCVTEKGTAGEIMTALYLLFCGDKLRRETDKYLRNFSISLLSWFSLLKSGGKNVADNKIDNSMKISFIQVCRNYFRGNGVYSAKTLEYMYHSAVATYTYPNCPAVDLIGSIQVDINRVISYRPLLVSVKCTETITPADAIEALEKMKAFLATIRKSDATQIPALCLLVMIGYEKPVNVGYSEYKTLSDTGYLNDDLGNFPNEDTYRLIRVPSKDSFGVSSALRETTATREMAEIYTSHPFFFRVQSLTDGAALRETPKDESLEYANAVHSAFNTTFSLGK